MSWAERLLSDLRLLLQMRAPVSELQDGHHLEVAALKVFIACLASLRQPLRRRHILSPGFVKFDVVAGLTLAGILRKLGNLAAHKLPTIRLAVPKALLSRENDRD